MIDFLDSIESPRLLFLGAHSDDIEIGAGGTVLRLLQRYPTAQVRWVVFSAPGERKAEAIASANQFLEKATRPQITVETFRESYFPSVSDDIKDYFERLKTTEPDLIFTHYRDDLHQDHRVICNLTWNTFRNHTILEYEIPKWDGDLGRPNVYVPLGAAFATSKIRHLMACFATQTSKNWFTEDTFLALMRIRGVECQRTYAEAFHGRKIVLR